MDAWSAPAPPFSADATAGTATAAATVATNAISVRFITPPWSSFSDAAPPGAADQPTRGTQPGRQVGRTIRRGLAGRRDGTRRITTSETNNESAAASATRSGGTGDPPPEAAPAEEGMANGSGMEGRSKGSEGARDPPAAPGDSGRFAPRSSRVETPGFGDARTSICAGGRTARTGEAAAAAGRDLAFSWTRARGICFAAARGASVGETPLPTTPADDASPTAPATAA